MSLPPENNNLHKLCTAPAPAPAPAPLYRCIVVSLFSTRRKIYQDRYTLHSARQRQWSKAAWKANSSREIVPAKYADG